MSTQPFICSKPYAYSLANGADLRDLLADLNSYEVPSRSHTIAKSIAMSLAPIVRTVASLVHNFTATVRPVITTIVAAVANTIGPRLSSVSCSKGGFRGSYKLPSLVSDILAVSFCNHYVKHGVLIRNGSW